MRQTSSPFATSSTYSSPADPSNRPTRYASCKQSTKSTWIWQSSLSKVFVWSTGRCFTAHRWAHYPMRNFSDGNTQNGHRSRPTSKDTEETSSARLSWRGSLSSTSSSSLRKYSWSKSSPKSSTRPTLSKRTRSAPTTAKRIVLSRPTSGTDYSRFSVSSQDCTPICLTREISFSRWGSPLPSTWWRTNSCSCHSWPTSTSHSRSCSRSSRHNRQLHLTYTK